MCICDKNKSGRRPQFLVEPQFKFVTKHTQARACRSKLCPTLGRPGPAIGIDALWA